MFETDDAFLLPEGLRVEIWLDTPDQTVALVTLNGVNRRVRNVGSTITYEVIAGEGRFHVGDDEPRQVTAGDSVTVEVGTPYHDEGELMMVATSTPRFNLASVVTLVESAS